METNDKATTGNTQPVKTFNNPQFGEIRTAGTSDEPLFCLADVCRVLELQTGATKNRLNEKGISSINTLTNGGMQALLFINEQNLYRVIMRSDKPQAEPFQDWVCGEVLPSIRKHGMYATEQAIDRLLQDPDFAIRALQNLKEERRRRIEAENKAEEYRPKALFADAVATSNRSCLMAELAKILQQNGVSIGQNRLFEWMRKNGFLCTKGQYYNQPTQKAMELGLFELKQTTITKPDGTVLVTTTTKVTGKGQIYFINKFLGKDKSVA